MVVGHGGEGIMGERAMVVRRRGEGRVVWAIVGDGLDGGVISSSICSWGDHPQCHSNKGMLNQKRCPFLLVTFHMSGCDPLGSPKVYAIK